MFNLLTLLDDIATTLDDVALMSKTALEKTSAIMSDDLAVNAGVVDGVKPDRELPIVKSIFIGSLINKVYCIVGALALMAIYPPLLSGIMLLGGLYLCFEGVEKIIQKLTHNNKNSDQEKSFVPEKEKIKGAVRTDLILSIEIIVIAKSTLTGPMATQITALIAVGLAASIIIYGLVAVIVKVDDFGLYLMRRGYKSVGSQFVQAMPFIMRGLGIVGTLAMLLVGGGILAHTFHFPYFLNEHFQNLLVGLIGGVVCVGLFELKNRWVPGHKPT